MPCMPSRTSRPRRSPPAARKFEVACSTCNLRSYACPGPRPGRHGAPGADRLCAAQGAARGSAVSRRRRLPLAVRDPQRFFQDHRAQSRWTRAGDRFLHARRIARHGRDRRGPLSRQCRRPRGLRGLRAAVRTGGTPEPRNPGAAAPPALRSVARRSCAITA